MRDVLPLALWLAACSPQPITLDTHVYEALTGNDLADVDLCDWPDAETCARTDARGNVSFEVLPARDYFGTMRKEGFYPRFFSFVTPEESEFLGENAMATDPAARLVLSSIGVDEQPGTGVIGFSTLLSDRITGVPDIAVSIAPETDGMVLAMNLGDEGFSTESDVTGEPGAGMWVNVPPGEYVVTFHDDRCERLFGLEADTPQRIRLQVIDGHWTHIDALCE